MSERKHILAVDDNPTNLVIMEESLEDDYDVTMAASGEEALEIAPKLHPDLILLDIMMPGLDGYETCQRLREHPDLANVRIIMVSAKAMTRERLMAYEAGADDYLTKPFAPAELLAKVRVHLQLCSMKEMSQLKNDVLGLLGHGTRTPLNGVLAGASLLMLSETMDDIERKQLGEVIHTAAQRLHEFLANVILLNALRSRQWELHKEPEDLAELVRDVARDAMPQAALRDLNIFTEVDAETMLEFDRTEMKRVVAAMLNNAIRFSPRNSKVMIRINQIANETSLEVIDQGDGILEKRLPNVLEPFGSAGTGQYNPSGGLSLAIAREIVQQHGGQFRIRNQPGGGVIASICLPSEVAA